MGRCYTYTEGTTGVAYLCIASGYLSNPFMPGLSLVASSQMPANPRPADLDPDLHPEHFGEDCSDCKDCPPRGGAVSRAGDTPVEPVHAVAHDGSQLTAYGLSAEAAHQLTAAFSAATGGVGDERPVIRIVRASGASAQFEPELVARQLVDRQTSIELAHRAVAAAMAWTAAMRSVSVPAVSVTELARVQLAMARRRGDKPPADHKCVVLYGGDASTQAARATGFTIKTPAAGQVSPAPKSGLSAIAVQQDWQNFRLDATRNLILDVVDAIQKIAGAVGKATTATALTTALEEVMQGLEPLLKGRKLIYEDTWGFTFTCETNDPDDVFEVACSIDFSAGLTTPGTADNVKYKLISNVTVDTAQPNLQCKADSAADGKEYSIRQKTCVKPITVGASQHRFSNTVQLELDVDGYGDSVKDIVTQVEDLVKMALGWLKKDKSSSSTTDVLGDVYGLVKAAITALLSDLTNAVTKTAGAIELQHSNVSIRCAGHQKAQ